MSFLTTPSGSLPPSRSSSSNRHNQNLSNSTSSGYSTPHLNPSNQRQNVLKRQSSYSSLSTTSTGATPTATSHNLQSTAGLGHRLRHMFESTKHAVFSVQLSIEEIDHVPQIEGAFLAEWKLRGKSPKHTELIGTSPLHRDIPRKQPKEKPSLPNLKFSPISPTSIHASSSNASLRSTSTGSSSLSPVSQMNPYNRNPPSKSLSTPPAGHLSTILGSPPHGHSKLVPKHPHKEATDPTPIRGRNADAGDVAQEEGKIPMSSPEAMIINLDDPVSVFDENFSQAASKAIVNQSLSSIQTQDSTTSSNSSSTTQLSVPFPKSISSIPTTMSTASTSESGVRSISMDRQTSRGTTHSTSSNVSNGALAGPGPGSLKRTRSSSAINPAQRPGGTNYSTHRKGATAVKPLKDHTCKWGQRVHHIVKFPISRAPATPTPGFATPARGPQSPILGAGPFSDSGLRLVIKQMPTPSNVSKAANHTPHHQEKSEPPESIAGVKAKHRHGHGLDGDEHHEKVKKELGEPTLFGQIDIDLAPFAGKGPTTRRFLLKSSRTNATVKITVDMKFIGGDESWTAPPLTEGHHVTQIKDYFGEIPDHHKPDQSASSGESSFTSLTRSHSISRTNSSTNVSRNHSSTSLLPSSSLPPASLGYKSYEHHLLKPSDAKNRLAVPPAPRRSPSHGSHLSPSSIQTDISMSPISPNSTALPSPNTDSPSSPPLAPTNVQHHLSVHRLHHHHHHSRHIRGRSHSPAPGSALTPSSLADGLLGSNNTELPPEVIIEAIFNPYPSSIFSPFTYVPDHLKKNGSGTALNDAVIVIRTDDGNGDLEVDTEAQTNQPGSAGQTHGKLGWGRMKARVKGKERTVSGLGIGGIASGASTPVMPGVPTVNVPVSAGDGAIEVGSISERKGRKRGLTVRI